MKQTGSALSALERLAAAAFRENPGWLDEAVDEHEAARVVGEAVSTLRSKRTRGGGPVFVKNGGSVKYIRRDLFAYLKNGRRSSTSDGHATGYSHAAKPPPEHGRRVRKPPGKSWHGDRKICDGGE